MTKNKKPELIAPAGDLEKLKIAFLYGADSVYASTPKFSMRTREIGFTEETLKEGIAYAHSLGKRVYLTLNTFPHSSEIEDLKKHAKKTIALKPDAIIVADPGILSYLKTITDIPIHLSTQANTTNYLSAEFWRKQGVERIVLARELNLKDIALISKNSKVEIEAFVHGAMCMAYSGRCQISNYMLGRDPNKGACAQPCRFKYKLYELEEEFRPGTKYPILEDENGSYLLNSKDLCMIEHIPELIKAGVASFKIEGRMKGIYYVGAVVRAYRQAIDQYFDNADEYKKNRSYYKKELQKTSSRGFGTGFYFNRPNKDSNNYETSRAKSEWDLLGVIQGSKEGEMNVEIRNRTHIKSRIEIVTPGEIIKADIKKMVSNGKELEIAHAGTIVNIPLNIDAPAGSFMRAKNTQ